MSDQVQDTDTSLAQFPSAHEDLYQNLPGEPDPIGTSKFPFMKCCWDGTTSIRQASTLCLAVLIVVVGQATQNTASPLWFHAVNATDFPAVNVTEHALNSNGGLQDIGAAWRDCADPFIMFEIMCLWYFPLFFVTATVVNLASGHHPFSFLWAYSARQHRRIATTGLSDSLNGALVITACPSKRTPAIIASLIGNLGLLPLIVIKHFYFRVQDFSVYRRPRFLVAVLLYLAASYTLVYPELQRAHGDSSQYWWWIVFFIGSVFGGFYNMQQVCF